MIHTPVITSQINADIPAGVDANGVALSASSVPYVRAWVYGFTRGADAGTAPTANTQPIFIATEDSLVSAIPVAASGVLELPPGCDLEDFLLMVTVADEGVIIAYIP